ncbi:GH92 family glycosyl hydrolase [Paenibacillus nitricinens]|uniref:GH92 family glycosyl hydrolase n=1 Tax=Paenibacillus nitricinens TaxID=3367691 RepID=UPI003F85D32C
MNKRRFRVLFTIASTVSLLIGSIPISPIEIANAAPTVDATNFFSSFESSDVKPIENTTELNANKEKMTFGVDGNLPFTGIQGDITKNIVDVQVNGENPPNETKDKLIDGTETTKWLTRTSTGWIKFKLQAADTITKYALTSANDANGRDPKDWKLYGSNDDATWTLLDTRTDVSFPNRYQRQIYDIPNQITPYLYYKFDITKNNGESLLQLAEIALSNGIDQPEPVSVDMKASVTNGPTSLYTSKTSVGWTGLKAITISGTNTVNGRAYAYNKIYDTDILVTPSTELSYYIAPEFTDKDQTLYTSTYTSVDLYFADGTYLHELGAVDQHGIKLNPQDQGKSKTLYNNQWNFKSAKIGDVAAGKTIQRILIAYDNPAAEKGTGFKGTIDDILIEGNPVESSHSRLSEYVNILRGTQSNGSFSRGNNIPAVAVPHGFNFWIPKTDAGSDWAYAYNLNNSANNLPVIQAFAMSHEPSPWMGDRQTFQVMPSDTAGTPSANRTTRQLEFKHANETAKPYYYGVTFENGIKTEFTPTDHAAMFRFTFTGNSSNLIFDNQSNSGGMTLNADGSIQGYSDQKSGNSNGATRMFYYATFDKPVVAKGNPTANGGGANVSRYYKFDTTTDKVVEMRIASSLLSVEQAKNNLNQEITAQDSFDKIKEKAQTQWDQLLGIIQVEGATEDQLVTLYSNLYRLYLWPNSAYENVGSAGNPIYKHANQSATGTCSGSTETETCAPIVEGKAFVNNGFWDTYRTTWPAYALLTPSKDSELIDGFVQQYKDGGWISRWSSPGYANIMVGTSADVAFADSYLKGATDFDVQSFYQAALRDAATNAPNANVGRKGMNTSVFNGYTSYNNLGEAMSWAMDGYINDFGIANLAKALAEKNDTSDPYNAHYKDDYQYYINRAQNYVNMFNPNLGFFNGRSSNGEWRDTAASFNPEAWGGGSGDYTETNGWNMAFHVPQDGQGLANLYGGKEELSNKLDEFFSTPETAKYPGTYGGLIHEMREARDVRMGQYGHSNQPSHHIPYMYNDAGEPWKTQEKVREVLDRLYIGSEIGQGYAGDEDNGEMSAWYIFSAMGFYPLKMGSPEYAIGAPLFKKATINLENGKQIVINAPNNSNTHKYVQSLKLNGVDYSKNYLLHSDLLNGATLDFDMGATPSKWGSGDDNASPSLTTGTDVPRPIRDRTDKLISQGLGKVTDNAGTSTVSLKNLFDNNSASTVSINSTNPTIQYQFTAGPEKISMYTLTSSGLGTEKSDPKSWVLKGSNEGVTWDTLDARKDESFQWRQYTRAFAITGEAEYSRYQLEITETNGGTSTALAEIELLGNDVSDENAVAIAMTSLQLGDVSHITTGIELPKFGMQGTTLTWSSTDTSVLSDKGEVVKRPDVGQPDRTVTLTVIISKGAVSQTKTFDVVVKAWSRNDLPHEEDFTTGLETGDILPAWNNFRLETHNVNGWCCNIGGMESKAGSVDIDQEQGITNSALLYSGNVTVTEASYSYNPVFEAGFVIEPSTVLTYRIHPEGPDAITQLEHKRELSAYISMDILFDDGTYLHDLNAVDQNGTPLNPLAQGEVLKLDTWNTVSAKIGEVAAGKVADKILISFNATGHTGDFRGYVDDIRIYHLADVPYGTDATLSGISMDGTGLQEFDSNKDTYDIILPAGSEIVPTVTATTYDPNATMIVTAADHLPGTTTIEVTAEDGITKLSYRINFTVQEQEPEPTKNSDATLSGIMIDGTALAGFDSSVDTYEVVLPAGTVNVPTLTANPTDSKATVNVTATDRLPGTSVIEVTAEDGSTKFFYKVNFTVQSSPSNPEPSNPNPSSPSPGGNTSTTTPPTEEKGKVGEVTIKPAQIVPINGTATLEMPAGTKELILPSDTFNLLGDSKLEVKLDNFTIVIPAKLFKQLSGELSATDLQNSSISLKLTSLTQSEVNGAMAAGKNTMNADIRSAGQGYDVSLALIGKAGVITTLDKFDPRITIRFHLDPSILSPLTGIYLIGNNGLLEYISGISADNNIVSEINQSGKYIALELTKKFADVPSTHWAASIIKELAAKQIITGTSLTSFQPQRSVTRAEFTALIVRALQLKGTNDTSEPTFTDIKATDWYAKAIAVAVAEGIVKGKGTSRFDPTAQITREEMVVMIIRAYDAVKGSKAEGSSRLFTDAAQIAAWAADDVNAAVSLRLIQGRDSGNFDPKGITTRAEAAQVIYNLLEIF